MKVRAPFKLLTPKHQVLASLRFIKIRVFSAAHPEGLVSPGHVYTATQHLPKALYVAPEFSHSLEE